MQPCPCNPSKRFNECCGKYLNGEAKAPDAETLMRSRYSAFALQRPDYIIATMKPPASTQFNWHDANEKKIEWVGLEIINSKTNGHRAWVEFIASYIADHKKYLLHEKSEFHLLEQQWYYVNGQHINSEHKIGRNDFCYCGSQKKFKKCCAK